MQDLRVQDLSISLEESAAPPALRLLWRGRSADRTPGAHLRPYFEQVLDTALERGLPVEMRFHELEHFNSATISTIIDLIQDAAARQVRLSLAYDGEVKWQRLSFDALRIFCRPDGLLTLTGA